MLTEIEKKVISQIQENIPVTRQPYLEMSKKLGISEEKLLEILQGLCDRGIIRRFGATLRHQKSGFSANAMAAWKVDEDRAVEVGKKMAAFKEVSHCYRRNPTAQWPYNLYTMVHAKDVDSCKDIVRRISEKTEVTEYTILFSEKEMKKTSMEYFSEASDD